jgi:hypothetical protein
VRPGHVVAFERNGYSARERVYLCRVDPARRGRRDPAVDATPRGPFASRKRGGGARCAAARRRSRAVRPTRRRSTIGRHASRRRRRVLNFQKTEGTAGSDPGPARSRRRRRNGSARRAANDIFESATDRHRARPVHNRGHVPRVQSDRLPPTADATATAKE